MRWFLKLSLANKFAFTTLVITFLTLLYPLIKDIALTDKEDVNNVVGNNGNIINKNEGTIVIKNEN